MEHCKCHPETIYKINGYVICTFILIKTNERRCLHRPLSMQFQSKSYCKFSNKFKEVWLKWMFLCHSYQPVPLHWSLNRKHCSREYSCQRVTTCNSNETSSYFIKGGEGDHRNVTVKNYLSLYVISLCWIFKGQGKTVSSVAELLRSDVSINTLSYQLWTNKSMRWFIFSYRGKTVASEAVWDNISAWTLKP